MGWETQPLPCDVARCGLTNPQHRGIIPCFLKQVLRQCEEQVLKLQYQLDKAVENDDSSFITGRAVCGESRTHGSDGGKLREKSTYPYKMRGDEIFK